MPFAVHFNCHMPYFACRTTKTFYKHSVIYNRSADSWSYGDENDIFIAFCTALPKLTVSGGIGIIKHNGFYACKLFGYSGGIYFILPA